MAAENENKNPAFIDGVENGRAVIFARRDIARSDPAQHAVLFQKTADLFADRFVFGRMTNEYGATHPPAELSADEYEDSGGECQDSHNYGRDRNSGYEHTQSREDEINREQQHSDVFSEVHMSILLWLRLELQD